MELARSSDNVNQLSDVPAPTPGSSIPSDNEHKLNTKREGVTASFPSEDIPGVVLQASATGDAEIQEEKEFDPVLKLKIDASMNQKELASLRFSIRSETSHGQWAKQGLCFLLLICLILMNLSMGSSSMPSIVGIEKCDPAYWAIQVFFMAICVVCTVVAVFLARRDQRLKLKYGGINISESDIRYHDNKSLAQLLVLGFAGGLVAGALGLGGGSIYNPALLSMGIPPKVSSATGLYLVTFSTVAAVLIYFINDQLDAYYGLWIGFWSCVGMVGGQLLTQSYMKKTGRQSIIVWCLFVIFLLSLISIPLFAGLSLAH